MLLPRLPLNSARSDKECPAERIIVERKLASIQRVLAIEPIANADAIELARINGWQCVVKKGEFAPGDLGVFLEIDSIPPDNEVFRFLWMPKSGEQIERPAKFRIRTMKLRGALSQGLLLPLSSFELEKASEGDDVTQPLGVEKYEPPAPVGMGDFRANFPGFIPKTDEMRVQSVPEVLDELRGLPYVATLKYDGTSSTFVIDPRTNEFHACGRNLSLQDGENIYWRAARKYDLEAVLRRSPNFAVQGELCGPGIQKNRLNLKELSLFVFNVYDFQNARYLAHDEARQWLLQNGLTPVETIEEGDSFAHTQDSLLALAEGKYPNTQNEREGIVIRPRQERFSPTLGGRLSFKAISNRFLLKEGE
jgi:RNA ligase (TIGR02306 family)